MFILLNSINDVNQTVPLSVSKYIHSASDIKDVNHNMLHHQSQNNIGLNNILFIEQYNGIMVQVRTVLSQSKLILLMTKVMSVVIC